MGDFTSKLFKFLAQGANARKKVPDNKGNCKKVPVWNEEQLFLLEQTKNDIHEILMWRAKRFMEITSQDQIEDEEYRLAQADFSVSFVSKAADRPFNKSGKNNHKKDHPRLKMVTDDKGVYVAPSPLDYDDDGGLNQKIVAAKKRLIVRGLVCPNENQ